MVLYNKKAKIDYILLFSVIALVIIGIVFVYSASYYTASSELNNKYYYCIKQIIGAVVGFVFLTLACIVNLEKIKKLYIVLYVLSVILLCLVFVPHIGIENYGAKRWIGFGSFSIQPSEIAKFAYVLFCAVYMSKSNTDMTKVKYNLPVIFCGILLCALIIIEPNMSITICIGATMLAVLFFGGIRVRNLVIILVPLLLCIPLLIVIEPYRLQRLLAFINPWASPKDEGYQLIQSLYALGSGGWFGVGLFNSRQKYKFLPFAESDFVFSIIGEEIGLIGCLFVMSLFVIVILRGIKIAVSAENKYKCYLSGGITAIIAVQSLINFAVVTGCIPPTGLPLPFVSYGGTSLVMFLTAVGALLNISRSNNSTLI